MKPVVFAATMAALSLLVTIQFSACSSDYKSGEAGEAQRATLEAEGQAAVRRFEEEDPTMGKFFDTCVGYVVFPDVGKGAIGIGGAYGRGVVYEKRDGTQTLTGYATLKQGTVGFQLD